MSFKKKAVRMFACMAVVMAVMLLSLGMTSTVHAAVTRPSTPVVTGKASGLTITLSWKRAAYADGYIVYKLKNNKFVKIESFASWKSVTRTYKEAYNGTYVYKVKAYRKVNGKYYYSDVTKRITVKTAPSTKANVTKTERDQKSSGVITWKTTKYADGYVIYRSTSKNGTYKAIRTINDGTVGSSKVTKLEASHKYYFKVRAFRNNASGKVYGGYGAVGVMPIYVAPTPTPTPTPQITPLPDQPTLTHSMVIVGDSLTANMQGYVERASLATVGTSYAANSKSIKWISMPGAKYSWLEQTACDVVSACIGNGTDIFIWLGVNDAWDSTIYKKYVALYQKMVPRWKALGARVFIVGLGPLGDPITENDEYYTNKHIEAFNTNLKTAITGGTIPGAVYVDVYSFIKSFGAGYLENDRYHFDADTSVKIFYHLLDTAVK